MGPTFPEAEQSASFLPGEAPLTSASFMQGEAIAAAELPCQLAPERLDGCSAMLPRLAR